MVSVGGATVRISPDLDRFRARLQAGMDAALAGVSGQARIGLDTAQAKADLAGLQAMLLTLGSQGASPTVSLGGVDRLNADIAAINANLAAFGSETVAPTVELGGTAEINARLAAVMASLNAIVGGVDVPVDVIRRSRWGMRCTMGTLRAEAPKRNGAGPGGHYGCSGWSGDGWDHWRCGNCWWCVRSWWARYNGALCGAVARWRVRPRCWFGGYGLDRLTGGAWS